MDILKTMTERSSMLRGNFITQVAYIEKLIDFFIAEYFCDRNDRVDEMVDLILGDRFISFDSKLTIYKNLIKKHNSKMYGELKEYFENLTVVQNQRNRLAHLVLDTTPEAQKRYSEKHEIGFIKFKEKTETFWYGNTEVEDLNKRLKMVYDTAHRVMIKKRDSSSTK